MKTKKNFKLITPADKTGLLFVLPFIIGFIWFFALPLLDSLEYTFNIVKVADNESGLEMTFVGLENYKKALQGDAAFLKGLIAQCSSMLVKVLVIMFMSMFCAMLLNDKFPGRLLFRTCLFLPVIFSADIVMRFMSQSGNTNKLNTNDNAFVMMSGNQMTGFVNEIINSFGFLSQYIKEFTKYAGSFFTLVWSMGIQVIIFIIGLKSIPAYLYEVADMEGATKWETFWKITFPLLTPSILLCFVYTIVDHFNSYNNPVIVMIRETLLDGGNFHYSSTQSWFYALIVFAFVLVAYGVLAKRIVRLD